MKIELWAVEEGLQGFKDLIEYGKCEVGHIFISSYKGEVLYPRYRFFYKEENLELFVTHPEVAIEMAIVLYSGEYLNLDVYREYLTVSSNEEITEDKFYRALKNEPQGLEYPEYYEFLADSIGCNVDRFPEILHLTHPSRYRVGMLDAIVAGKADGINLIIDKYLWDAQNQTFIKV